MEQPQEYGEELIVDSSFDWMAVVLPVVYVGAILYFGYQTWELVDHLFPAENLFMKVATVLTFDFSAAIWMAMKMFGKFHVWSNYGLARGMWRVTFTLATLASAIQMYLQAIAFTYGSVDVRIVYIFYALVVIAAVVNIIAFGHVINTEWDARHPRKFYPHTNGGNVVKQKPAHGSNRFIERAKGMVGAGKVQPASQASLPNTGEIDYDKLAERIVEAQKNPLDSPQLQVTAPQSGNGNGSH